jgi:hypothetical protein
MAREKQDKNVLDMIPARVHEWVEEKVEGEGEEGEMRIRVKVPRFKSRLGKRFCRWLKKPPTYDVKLDRYGSEAWKLCDGKNDVGTIAESLLQKFGEDVEPVYERVAKLITIMEINGLITYKNVKGDS